MPRSHSPRRAIADRPTRADMVPATPGRSLLFASRSSAFCGSPAFSATYAGPGARIPAAPACRPDTSSPAHPAPPAPAFPPADGVRPGHGNLRRLALVQRQRLLRRSLRILTLPHRPTNVCRVQHKPRLRVRRLCLPGLPGGLLQGCRSPPECPTVPGRFPTPRQEELIRASSPLRQNSLDRRPCLRSPRQRQLVRQHVSVVQAQLVRLRQILSRFVVGPSPYSPITLEARSLHPAAEPAPSTELPPTSPASLLPIEDAQVDVVVYLQWILLHRHLQRLHGLVQVAHHLGVVVALNV